MSPGVPAQRPHFQISGLDGLEDSVEKGLGVAPAPQSRDHLDVGDHQHAIVQPVLDDADDPVVSQFVAAGGGVVGDVDVEPAIGCIGTVAIHEIAP